MAASSHKRHKPLRPIYDEAFARRAAEAMERAKRRRNGAG